MCMDTPFFIFINGKGSSGKDTQAGFLKDYFGEKAITLSTGEICRDAQKEASPYYQYLPRIAPYIYHVEKEGGYYPDELIIGIVQDIVENQIAEDKNVFIFTGFPRTEGQLMAVEGMLVPSKVPKAITFTTKFPMTSPEIAPKFVARMPKLPAKKSVPMTPPM